MKENESRGNILYVLNVLKKYSDIDHLLTIKDIQEKIECEYKVTIDGRTIRRNINLLNKKAELDCDIITFNDNKKGYYYNKNLDKEFTLGEVVLILNLIQPYIGLDEIDFKMIRDKLIKKLNVYEQEMVELPPVGYSFLALKQHKDNEVLRKLDDVSYAIGKKKKIRFLYENKNMIVSPIRIEFRTRTFDKDSGYGYFLYGTILKNNKRKFFKILIMKDIEIID